MVTSDFRDNAAAAYEVRKELGPEYESAVLESFVANATQSINQQVDARLAEHAPVQKQSQPDNSHLAVPVFSLLLGVIGSVWLTAGAHAESGAVFAMWLGITLVNIVFMRMFKSIRRSK
ncbi:hypothetical protein EV649_2974 [Kribbella sp. VKM Ac-2569]|uniref:hypothetical protein n=1 Tax=Kribbella sp. VKM Ac-2569 TaxID=2512220 RepID=UPI00102BAADF|nr:hypothetical protein [Kribbella sp. VKM Ac-2569]RZT19835.1 hypothetical protein EV649_2974 [Kribbella sp. VKM Ac-2569]